MPTRYTDSNYTFTDPTPDRRYIEYLAQIEKCNANGFNPTRKQVQVALGDPDPTQPNDWNRREALAFKRARHEVPVWLKRGSNWGISRWTAMKQAGLIRSERVGNTVRYQITGEGFRLLHSVL